MGSLVTPVSKGGRQRSKTAATECRAFLLRSGQKKRSHDMMRGLVVGVSFLCASAWTLPARAQDPEAVAKAACEQAVTKKLGRLYPKTDAIEFGESRMTRFQTRRTACSARVKQGRP